MGHIEMKRDEQNHGKMSCTFECTLDERYLCRQSLAADIHDENFLRMKGQNEARASRFSKRVK